MGLASGASLEFLEAMKGFWKKWNLEPKYWRGFWGPYNEYVAMVAWLEHYTLEEYTADVADINRSAAARTAFVNETAKIGGALEHIPDANSVGGIAMIIPQLA